MQLRLNEARRGPVEGLDFYRGESALTRTSLIVTALRGEVRAMNLTAAAALLLLVACGSAHQVIKPEQRLAYPPARRDDVKDVIHGVTVEDPYRWLEDAKSPGVQAWMKAQADFTRARLDALPERPALVARLKELLYLDQLGAPQHRGGRYFFGRLHADKEKSIIYWKEGHDGPPRVLLDPNTWSKDGSAALGGWSVSWDGKRVAYQLRPNNSDEATLYLQDVATGQRSEIDTIEGAKYATASWTPSGGGFYYTWLPLDPKITVAERPGFAEVRFHKLGTDPKLDPVIHQRTGDAKTFIGADLSRDGHWLLLTVSHGWNATDVYYRDTRKKSLDWEPLAVGKDATYTVWPWKDRFYIRTNDGAPLGKMVAFNPTTKSWATLVPERTNAKLEGFSIVGNRLALTYLEDATTRLYLHGLDGKSLREQQLPGLGSASGLIGNEDEDEAYYTYESFTYPREIYQTSVASGASKLFFRLKAPIHPADYQVEQLFFASKDGTRVPMFVIHRKDYQKDGSAPAILYGYGGFTIALTPTFSPSYYAWLERGGVYAVVNLRGGDEYGEAWHRAGMLLKKQNVFDDVEAAGEALIREGYTKAERLAIRGGSNGGLLVGAALTQRPDLFRVALCGVPLLDMVRYHLFGSGKTWVEEYGSAEDPEQFKAILAYSPYQNIKPGRRYPATLFLSADADDRVDPMHARKMAAALQAASSGGPVLLRIEQHAGHGGADLVKAHVEQIADEYAFALSQMELSEATVGNHQQLPSKAPATR